MRFILKGKASEIMRNIEAIHLNRWKVKPSNQNSADIENNLIYPLYVEADQNHDHVITSEEAKRYRMIYQIQFDRSSMRVTFPPR